MKRNRIYAICFFVVAMGMSARSQTLTLEQCRQLAINYNYQIKNSTLALDAARAVRKEAYTHYFPNVSASAIGMQALDPLLRMKTAGGDMGLLNQLALGYLNVVQPLYSGGRIKMGNKLAVLNVEVQERRQRLSENEVLLKMEQQYWQVITIREKQQTLASYQQFLDTLYKQVDDAYRNGMITKNDLLRVSIRHRELEVNKMQLENGEKLALMQLCQTIGMEYRSGIVLADNLDTVYAPDAYFVIGAAVLAKRPEYQLLEKSVDAATLETKMKKGDYLPTVGIGAAGYYLNQFEPGQQGVFNGMVYASVSIPISDWWGRKPKLQEMKNKEQATQNTLEDHKGLLLLQVEQAWTDLNEASEQIRLMEETLLQATENVKVNRDSYNNGLVALSDLLEAQALKAETIDKLTEARSRYKLAITNYQQVTGR
ncbi:Outer membrane protein TolC [Parapedobacter koreensis]|uniref:Outer membrane protein TolC n=2 Tax=Parapedobacter koreensis TaxID=332977 RepID=A0A1H7STU0_9SPHI|nr:Outer membrane protein TolC [Parapedobacter koreensis]